MKKRKNKHKNNCKFAHIYDSKFKRKFDSNLYRLKKCIKLQELH